MALSIFELFKVGIGPSSSHTTGPMKAAFSFVSQLACLPASPHIAKLRVELFGSLGHTGRGHHSDQAIILGLLGQQAESLDPNRVSDLLARAEEHGVPLPDGRVLPFDSRSDLIFHKRQSMPLHSNGMRFFALDSEGKPLLQKEYYSIGGGFVRTADELGEPVIRPDDTVLPWPFGSARELLKHCSEQNRSIASLVLENECAFQPESEVREGLLRIWQVMQDCVQRGLGTEGVLPGGLKVSRRAASQYQNLKEKAELSLCDHLAILDWVNVYALAVSEENAAGGRVVTAPTNGAAGIIPAVLHYYRRFCGGASEQGVVDFLLTAGAIGMLYYENASISGAEVGCQGEVGVACSMAAAGLTAVLGGTPSQVENAAEIAMEHNLGLTCDPIGGLVQIPCIERNAMASIKAINAQRLALRGDGQHFVSLDKVIHTMRLTGADMKTKYKETSRGGLAVNLVEC